MKHFSPVAVAHRFVRSLVRPGDLCVDATVGNGHDTALLAQLVGEAGQVLGFDVQVSALEAAQYSLAKHQLDKRVALLHQGHETVSEVLSKRGASSLNLAMFNLGYLPGSNKSIVTQTESTLKALQLCLENLDSNGAISIVAYRGHDGGNEESMAVETWVEQLPVESFFCLRFERWSHERGLTPVFFWVRKRD